MKFKKYTVNPKFNFFIIKIIYTSNAGTSAESENSSYNIDDASAVLDDSGSLGSLIYSFILF